MSGLLPGVVYGNGFESVSIAVEPKPLLQNLRGDYGLNAIFRLEIEGHDQAPVVRVVDYQRDPVRRNLKHVDFEVLSEDKVISVKVPLILNGVPVGVSVGGKLRQIRHEIAITAKGGDIPKNLAADVSELNIGDNLGVSQLDAPEGVSLVFDDNYSIATVFVPRGVVEEDSSEEMDEEEGEES